MLIAPRPGTSRERLLETLRTVHTTASNTRSAGQGSAYDRLLDYLEWAQNSARQLKNQVSPEDLATLVLTKRHDTLLDGVGHLAATSQQRLVHLLVDQELADRIEGFEAVIDFLKEQDGHWAGRELLVVADTSFYCHNPERLELADLHQILGLQPSKPIRMLFPIVVVDELDGRKESGKQQARWRAPHALGLLDEVLQGGTFGVWKPEVANFDAGDVRGRISMEIVLDQRGHVRLPIADEEIIDRAVAIQALSGRPVRLLTCDTSQHTRGCAAGLEVTKIPTQNPGPEPDWDSQGKPGTGVRAQRRARHEAATNGG
ncbi:PIN domain-containing protein [Streptomyces aureus]|uniref:PIN domain-containing protein n=1 Tax=Streptomyces aureus TaxID=193461 RepID=UPI0036B247F6